MGNLHNTRDLIDNIIAMTVACMTSSREADMRTLLYSNGSPFARRVRVVLIEKNLEFESDIYDGLRPIPEIKDQNPALQVPVLYDRDQCLFGSNLILQYLYAEYPGSENNNPPLAPTITRPERHWEDMLTLTAIESLADTIVGLRLLLAGGKIENPYIERQHFRITSCLDWLEGRITPEGFWPGIFSIMDLNLMCPLLYGEYRDVFAFRDGPWRKITAMVEHWGSRPSVQKTPLKP